MAFSEYMNFIRGVTVGGAIALPPFGRIEGAAAIAAILLLAPPLLESHLRLCL